MERPPGQGRTKGQRLKGKDPPLRNIWGKQSPAGTIASAEALRQERVPGFVAGAGGGWGVAR